MINGVIVQKLQTLDDVLLELRSLGDVTTEQHLSDVERFRDEVLAYVQG